MWAGGVSLGSHAPTPRGAGVPARVGSMKSICSSPTGSKDYRTLSASVVMSILSHMITLPVSRSLNLGPFARKFLGQKGEKR